MENQTSAKMADKYLPKHQPAVQRTGGINRTTPNLGKNLANVKIPVDIHSRLFRDPKKSDLVDIERAKKETEEKLKFLSEQAKSEISKKKQEKEEAQFKLKLQEALDAEKKKGEAQ